MPCSRCDSDRIVMAGKYKVNKSKIQHRLRCKNCGHTFIIKTLMYRKKIPLKVRNKIKTLYKRKKYFISKYDSLKIDIYPTRDIATMLGVSKSFVYGVIKTFDIKNKIRYS